VVEARDEDGDLAIWPASGVSWVDIGPPGHPPEVVGLAPVSGPAAGGTEVLLRGAGFALDTEVRFDGELAPELELASEHLLVVRTPPGAPGAVDVTVARAGLSTTLAGAFTYLPPPEITNVAPAEGPTEGGTLVVVDGAFFQDGAVASFDEGALPTLWLAPGRLMVTAPPHEAGAVDVHVANPDGQRGTLERGFRYRPPPRLTAIDPSAGPDTGGSRVRLEGASLRGPGAVYIVDRGAAEPGGRPATDVTVEPGGLGATFVTPLHPEGVVDVVWFNPDGQSATIDGGFRFIGPPVVVEIEPPLASRCGGSLAVVVGRNFVAESRVFVGGVEVQVRGVSADGTRLEVVLPPGAPGDVRVEVVNPDGRSAAADDVLEFGIRPVLRSVDVRQHPVWGGTEVTIEGGDFEPGASAAFGGVPAERTIVRREGCDAVIDAIVPAHEAGVVEVTVTNLDGSAGTRRDAVEYIAPTLDPPRGLVPGYTNAALRGVDLRRGLIVRIGGNAVRDLQRVSDEEWRVVTAAGERGAADVEVRNRDGRGVVLEAGFSVRVWQDATAGRFEPGFDCNDVSVGDVDGDGDPDVVAAHGAVAQIGQVEQNPRVHLNDGRGRFRARSLNPPGNGMNARLGDYDGDGDPDLLLANLSSSRNHLFRNDGRGGFAEVRDFLGRGPSYDADFLDHDGDGDLDVFLLSTGSPENNAVAGPENLLINQGGGRFADASDQVYFSLTDVHDHDFSHGDLDGDGLPDVVIVVDNLSNAFEGSENRVLLNRDGAYVLQPAPFADVPGDWLNVELADIDADGDLDVLLPQDYVEGFSRPGTPALGVYLNDGRANFEAAHHLVHGYPRLPAFEAVATDVDLDGDIDVLVAVYGVLFQDGNIDAFASTVLLNDGTGHLYESASAFEVRLDIASADFGAADFDGDEDVDLVECAARGQSRLWIQVE